MQSMMDSCVQKSILAKIRDSDRSLNEYFSIGWFTEVLVRKLLRLRTRKGSLAAAVLYLETGWRGKPFLERAFWNGSTEASFLEGQNGDQKKELWFTNLGSKDSLETTNKESLKKTQLAGLSLDQLAINYGSSAHYNVLNYYQIPTINMADVLFPFAIKDYSCKGAKADEDCGSAANNAYWDFFMKVHTDHCCHPKGPGHSLLALLLGYNLNAEAKLLDEINDEDASVNGDGSLSGTHLHPVLLLQGHEDETYALNNAPLFTMDFATTSAIPAKVEAFSANTGWLLMQDVAGKPGLIADRPFAHFSLPLNVGKKIKNIQVGFLLSYNDFSAAACWVDTSSNLEQGKNGENGFCAKDIAENEEVTVINGFERDHVSVYHAEDIKYPTATSSTGAGQPHLHCCLLPRTQGQDNQDKHKGKFKIFSIQAW